MKVLDGEERRRAYRDEGGFVGSAIDALYRHVGGVFSVCHGVSVCIVILMFS